MKPAQRVYVVGPSFEDWRPMLSYDDQRIDWLRIGDVLRGDRPVEDYEFVSMVVDHPEASEWDFYMCGGSMGLLSGKAAQFLKPCAAQCFDLLEASLNDAPFFFLRIREYLDCLDRGKSEIVPYRHDSRRIKQIRRYSFFKDRIPDPSLFVIPEGFFGPFGTDGVVRIIRNENLRGFHIVDAESGIHW